MKCLPETSTNDGKQLGFTLIELMISIVIGLIILAAVVGLFVSMTKSDSDNLKAIRLNQQLRATMSLIARDLRRAGANRNAATDSTPPPSNPFSIAGGTRLTIANYNGKANAQVTYSYDVDPNAAACTAENFGYRWDSNTEGTDPPTLTVESFSGSSAAGCGAGAWTAVTDSDLVDITDDGQTTSPGYVAGTPRGLQFADTFIDEAGVRVHQITVTIWGRLKKDHTVMRSLSETIKIRNDEML